MEEQNIFALLPDALLPWYDRCKRELPWRSDRQPYHVWLSEIMLQQTRVEAVKGYYARFLESCPDVAALAAADDELLHKLWEGLGYYNRVRNLKKAAKEIMEQYGGEFPGEYEQILALPGIGEYTAGAISSIAFDQPKAAVDGNVLRVAARLTEDTTPIDLPACKKAVKTALEAVYPVRAGDFTQALMELGATVCLPNGKPLCHSCPCSDFCRSCSSGRQEELPVRLPKRTDQQAVLKVEEMGLKVLEIRRSVEKKHIFTHIEWHMKGYYMEVQLPSGAFSWQTRQQIETSAALPTAYRQFWEETDYV